MVNRIPTTQTILTRLNRANCPGPKSVSHAAKNDVVRWSIGLVLNWNRHSHIAQAGPTQSVECRDFPRHLIEQAFDARKTVLAGNVVNQLVQKFPFRPGVATRL